MNSNPAEIGQRIKEARKAAKLSQTELAGQLEKTLRTVQKYESGEIEPSIATINSIARILNVSPAELIGYSRKTDSKTAALPDCDLTLMYGDHRIMMIGLAHSASTEMTLKQY